MSFQLIGINTDRKNVTDFLYLVLHLACKVTCYFQLFSLVLVSVLRTSISVLSKSKSRNYVTWIANLTKLFLSVMHLIKWFGIIHLGRLQFGKGGWGVPGGMGQISLKFADRQK